MLKHCAADRKRRISALPNVSPYIYDVKISGENMREKPTNAPIIYSVYYVW
jgi:hypothetical protein